jgi:6-phosphogluconolactonase
MKRQAAHTMKNNSRNAFTLQSSTSISRIEENPGIRREKSFLNCCLFVLLLASIAGQPLHAFGITQRYAYVVDPVGGGGGQIFTYAILPGGALAPVVPCFITADPLNAPSAAVVDRNGAFLYVANTTGNNIGVYSINPNSGPTQGCLTFMGPTPLGLGAAAPVSLAITAHDAFLFVSERTGTIDAYTINNGVLTLIGGSPFPTAPCVAPGGIAVDLTESYLFLADNAGNVCSFTYFAGGVLSPALPTPLPGFPNQVAVDSVGQFLYVTNSLTNQVFSYQIGAGAVLIPTAPALAGTGAAPFGVGVNPFGQEVFVANNAGNSVSPKLIESPLPPAFAGSLRANGATNVLPLGSAPVGLTVDQTGNYLYVTESGVPNNVVAFKISDANGRLGLIGAFPTIAGAAPWAIATQP